MSELSRRIIKLSESDDFDGMNQLLLEWPEKNAEWFMHVDMCKASFGGAGRTGALLKQAKLSAHIANLTAAEPMSPFCSPANHGEFVVSDKDALNNRVLKRLEKARGWSPSEISDYLASLEYESLDEPVQHAINTLVYWLRSIDSSGQNFTRIAGSEIYQRWQAVSIAESILANACYGIPELKRACLLENEIQLIKLRNYYVHLLAQEGASYLCFEQFITASGGLHQFDAIASAAEIRDFERAHAITLPSELIEFYQTIGQLNGTADHPCAIYSIASLHNSLNQDTSNATRLDGLGLVDMLMATPGKGNHKVKLAGGGLTTQQIERLNQRYKSIGCVAVDDNTHVVLYFDEQHKFGAVWYNQDDNVVVSDYLYPMLEHSPAQYRFSQLFSAIRFILEVRYDQREHESIIKCLCANPS